MRTNDTYTMTEAQLREEEQRLRKAAESGQFTSSMANRLREINAALANIRNAQQYRPW